MNLYLIILVIIFDIKKKCSSRQIRNINKNFSYLLMLKYTFFNKIKLNVFILIQISYQNLKFKPCSFSQCSYLNIKKAENNKYRK